MNAKKTHAVQRPTLLDVMSQSSVYGTVIPRIYGMTKSAPKIIWAAGLRKGGSSKKGKKAGKKGAPPTYIANMDFLIASNPIAGVNRTWNNAAMQPLNFVTYTVATAGVGPGFTMDFSGHPLLYAVIGVTAVADFSVPFNDYGGDGPVTLAGTCEVPLSNTEFQGPDPTNSNGWRNYPFTYRWIPGSSIVYIENFLWMLPGGVSNPTAFKVYVVEVPAGAVTPLAFNRLSFEAQLGSGSEYTGYGAQQIQYPMYAGVGSPDFDLGSGPALPNLKLEVAGSYPFFYTGDAEFADIAEDIIKMGQAQAALELQATSNLQFGAQLYNYPGMIQLKLIGAATFIEYADPKYDRPNTAGNILIASAYGQVVGGIATVSDSAGNAWTQVFGAFAVFPPTTIGLAYVVGCLAANGNTVNYSQHGFGWSQDCYELAGVDTLDSAQQHTGTGATDTFTVVTTNAPGTPAYIFIYVAMKAGQTAPTQLLQPDLYKPLISSGQSTPFGSPGAGPTGYSTFYRVVWNPGSYTIVIPTGGTFATAVLVFKSSQPPNYAKPLGDIVDLATMNTVRAQCRAYGLMGSLVMDSQRAARDWLTDLYACMNAWPVWSGFRLKSIALAEQSTYAQGAQYTAPTASGPVANLLPGDFIDSQGLITVKRKATSDAQPVVQIQHPDRSNSYNSALTSQPDNGAITLRGTKKKDTRSWNMIQDSNVARSLLGVLVRRSVYLMNTYLFKLQPHWKLLEAGDLVTVTDPQQGITLLPVRLTKVEEDEKFNLTVEAEDFMFGVNTPIAFTTTPNQQNDNGIGALPGSVNAPYIFVVPAALKGNSPGTYLRLLLSGASANWGGCIIWASSDGTTYLPVGVQVGQSTMGLLTGVWPAGTDPDSVNSLLIDLTESFGVLADFSLTDENNLVPIFVVDGGTTCIPFEIGAYALATLTSAYHYTLAAGGGQVLRRGQYATPISSHGIGKQFGYLGPGSVFTDLLANPQWIGKTIQFKFTSFNLFELQTQALTDPAVIAYPYTIPVPCTASVQGGRPDKVIALTPGAAGNFSVAHGLASTPALVLVQMTSDGNIWLQAATRYDATNIYFTASDAGITGRALVYTVAPTAEVALAPGAPGNFDVAHALGIAPAVMLIQMTSDGNLWTQTPAADAANLHLVASDGGLTGFAELWNLSLSPTAIARAEVALAPAVPGNFAVPHGLGVVPTAAIIRMSSDGNIWFQPALYDAANIYLTASDGGITGQVEVFA